MRACVHIRTYVHTEKENFSPKHGHLLNLLATPVTLCKVWQSGSNIHTEKKNYHTSNQDLGPDLQPGDSRPGDGRKLQATMRDGDVQCMHAGTAAGTAPRSEAPAAGRISFHRRGAHAGNTHKHDSNVKQSVYTARLSTSPTNIYTERTPWVPYG